MIVIRRSGTLSAARGTSQVYTDRPQNPKQWQIWIDPDTLDQEVWDGAEWTVLTKLDSIFSRFGLGSDGDVVIASGTTTLTADVFYNTLSISSGATLKPNGFRVFCRGKLTNNGNIDFSAADGANGKDGGASAQTGGSGGGTITGYLGASAGGGGGGSSDDPPQAGTSGTSKTNCLADSVSGGNGGTGGGGQSQGGAGAGGGGGATTASVNDGSTKDPEQAITFRTRPDGSSANAFNGGGGAGGGGGGGNDAPASRFGGSGAGGGSACPSAVVIASIVSGSGTVTAIGGDGGDGGKGLTGDTGGGGGGGGAQGGQFFLIFSRKEDFGWTITLTGGIGGVAGAGSGTGDAGNDGTDGSAGVNFEYDFS